MDDQTDVAGGTERRGGTVIDWSRFGALWARQAEAGGHALRSVTAWVAVALWLLALLLVFLTWKGAADRPLVAEQVPYLVSGGLTALLLTGIGCSVFLYGVLASPASAAEEDGAEVSVDDESPPAVRALRRA